MISLHFGRDMHVTRTDRAASFLGSVDGLSTFVLHRPPPESTFSFHAAGHAIRPAHISCAGPFFRSPSPPRR